MRYSRIYKVGDRRFRYNYDKATLQLVQKMTKAEVKANESWKAQYGEPLYISENNEFVIEEEGLCRENWEEGPRYWCEAFSEELDEELAWMMHDLKAEFGL